MSTFTAGLAFKHALFEAIRDLYAANPETEAVLVCPGMPGTYQPEEIVSVTRLQVAQTFATMGHQRSREETLTVDVVFSVIHGGGGADADALELSSQARSFELLGMIEHHVRKVDTTLGGVVRQCLLTSVETDGQTPEEYLAQGRGVDVTATFTAQNRVTG
jgi:hypothetical protein